MFGACRHNDEIAPRNEMLLHVCMCLYACAVETSGPARARGPARVCMHVHCAVVVSCVFTKLCCTLQGENRRARSKSIPKLEWTWEDARTTIHVSHYFERESNRLNKTAVISDIWFHLIKPTTRMKNYVLLPKSSSTVQTKTTYIRTKIFKKSGVMLWEQTRKWTSMGRELVVHTNPASYQTAKLCKDLSWILVCICAKVGRAVGGFYPTRHAPRRAR